jgi:hypothetical protein
MIKLYSYDYIIKLLLEKGHDIDIEDRIDIWILSCRKCFSKFAIYRDNKPIRIEQWYSAPDGVQIGKSEYIKVDDLKSTLEECDILKNKYHQLHFNKIKHEIEILLATNSCEKCIIKGCQNIIDELIIESIIK